MKIIGMNMLNGVPDRYSSILESILEKRTNKEKLIVALYFMNDLEDDKHHLSNIEYNVRKLYKDEYIKGIKDFQSSNVRGIINTDKESKNKEKYFLHLQEGIKDGYWSNSEKANRRAIDILAECGIALVTGVGLEGSIEIDTNIPIDDIKALMNEGSKEYRETLVKFRRGQQKFRNELINAYNSTCCITGEKCSDVLEAAHIIEYINKDSNYVGNGLLLRCDWHKLYDRNLVYIDENYIIHISSKVESEYYQSYNNKKINLEICLDKKNYPSKDALRLRKERFIK